MVLGYNFRIIKIFITASALFILITDQYSEKGPSNAGLDQKCEVNDDCYIKGSYCRQSFGSDQSTCQCDDDRYVPKNGKCVFALPCHLDGTNDECPPQHNCTRDSEDPEDPEDPEDSEDSEDPKDPKTEMGYCDFQPIEYDENGRCPIKTWSTADDLDCIKMQFCKTDQDCYGKGKHQKCVKEYGKRVCRCPEGTQLTKRSECLAGDNDHIFKSESTSISPAQSSPAQSSPAQSSPAQSSPAQSSPAQSSPAQSSPAQSSPAQSSPAQSSPAQSSPAQSSPAQSSPSPNISAHSSWNNFVSVIIIIVVVIGIGIVTIEIGCFFVFCGKKTQIEQETSTSLIPQTQKDETSITEISMSGADTPFTYKNQGTNYSLESICSNQPSQA